MRPLDSRYLPGPDGGHRPFLAVILAAIILRLALLAIFGPRPSYDSIYEYIPFAHLIRDGTAWLSDAGLADAAVPLTTFRMIGYPALIALLERLVGEGWPWLLVLLQVGASMAAILSIMLLAEALAPARRWIALAAGLATACGQTLNTDTAIQTDSLSAAALVTFAALSARGALLRHPIGSARALCLGLLPAASFLMRENTDATVLTLLPFALAWILRTHHELGRRLFLALFVLMPLIVANSAQLLWNTHRTGSAFLTTGTQVILLQALMHAAWSGTPVFDGGGPMDRAADEVLGAKEHPDSFFTQEELWSVNQRLFDNGANAVEIARQMRAAYARAWAKYPLGMARAALGNLSPGLLFVLGNGVHMDMRALLFGRPGEADIGVARRIAGILLFALSLALGGMSLAITMGFLLSPLAAAYGSIAAKRQFSEADWFRLAVLIASLAFLGLHAIVHFEERFLAPIEPLAIVSGITGLAQAGDWFNRRRGRLGFGQPVRSQR